MARTSSSYAVQTAEPFTKSPSLFLELWVFTRLFLRLPKEPAVITDGFRLLPHLVKPLLTVRSHAVWLLPTPEFRQAVVDSRGGPKWGFLGETSDPERALRNLLERDAMFTHRLYDEAKRLELNIIEVDTAMTVDDLARRVTDAFVL